MQYNDNIIINDNTTHKLNTEYSELIIQENNDLIDIITKMKNHKENLTHNNIDGRYDEVLSNLTNNITKLSQIIDSNTSKISTNNNFQKSSTFGNFYQSISNAKITQNDDTSPSPVRGKMEMENFSSYADNLGENTGNNFGNFNSSDTSNPLLDRGTFDTINNGDNTSAISPIRSDNENINTNNTPKRNSPMQSSFIFNLVKRLNLGFGKSHRNNLSQKKSSKDNSLLDDRQLHLNLRYHNISSLSTPCHKDRCVVGEFDILRLLLLIIATRPHSPHHNEICSITMVELENLHILVTDRNGQ